MEEQTGLTFLNKETVVNMTETLFWFKGGYEEFSGFVGSRTVERTQKALIVMSDSCVMLGTEAKEENHE